MLEQIQEFKTLFNAYGEAKHGFSLSHTPGNEARMGDALASALRKGLDIFRALKSRTESKTEQDLFRQFAAELTKVFK